MGDLHGDQGAGQWLRYLRKCNLSVMLCKSYGISSRGFLRTSSQSRRGFSRRIHIENLSPDDIFLHLSGSLLAMMGADFFPTHYGDKQPLLRMNREDLLPALAGRIELRIGVHPEEWSEA